MPIFRAEVAVCGPPQSGKSSLIAGFIADGSKNAKTLLPTMAPEVFSKKVKIPDSNDQVELLIIDTPSHALAQPLAHRSIAECKFIILVINGQDKESERLAKDWMTAFRDATTIDKPKGILVKNFAFESEDALSDDQMQILSQQLGLAVAKCNAVQGKNVELPFQLLAQMVYNLQAKAQ